MKTKFYHSFITLLFYIPLLFSQWEEREPSKSTKKERWKAVVVSKKKLKFDKFPNAFNPSIAHTNFGLLMSFRYCPDTSKPWISQIGIVQLDEKTLKPLSTPQIIDTRENNELTPSQAEDARLFYCDGKTYLIYNDNETIINPSIEQRRDMHLAEVGFLNNKFVILNKIKLYHQYKYKDQLWQKNWSPFVKQGNIFITFSSNPHEVLYPDLSTGLSMPVYKTQAFINWAYGVIRGGTPALEVDGEYLGFFHSSLFIKSPSSTDIPRHHYFMGAYTFSLEPPFNLTKISSLPITSKGFYNKSKHEKRVIFPGGFYILKNHLHVAYGKDDCEIWIASLDKNILLSILEPIQEFKEFEKSLEEVFEYGTPK